MAEVADTTDTADVTSAADAAVAASTEATTETTKEAPKTLTGESPTTETTTAEVVYDLKLPENSVLPETAIERTTAIARESGLSAGAAQKLLESLNTEVSANQAAYFESIKPGGADWTERVSGWEAQALKDTEIGGTPEKLQESVALAKNVLKDFADPQVSAWLHETGFGSHPMVIRMLAKVAKATSEGTVHPTGSQVGGQKKPENKMYDHPDNYKTSQETTT